jgi:hypothetical protein
MQPMQQNPMMDRRMNAAAAVPAGYSAHQQQQQMLTGLLVKFILNTMNYLFGQF